MIKTINELNSRVWYRVLKVLYIFSFIAIVAITLFLVFVEHKTPIEEIDHSNTKIICNLGNKNTFNKNQVFEGLDQFFKEEQYYKIDRLKSVIQNKCEITQEILNKFELTRGETKDGRTPVLWSDGESSFNATINGLTGYEIEEKYKYTGGLDAVIGYSILSLLVLIIIFEAIRRIFYYIILGKLMPRK